MMRGGSECVCVCVCQAHQESLSQQLSAEKERGEAELKSVRRQLEMVQQSLQMEQRARQEEQEHHADMLKELQGLITSERASKQTLAEKLKETESKMANLEVTISAEKYVQSCIVGSCDVLVSPTTTTVTTFSSSSFSSSVLRSEEYKQQVKQLSEELANVKAHLHAAEKQSSQPSPLLIQLQDDLRRVKVCWQCGTCSRVVCCYQAHGATPLHRRTMNCHCLWSSNVLMRQSGGYSYKHK